jgi:hypothetical protein
VETPPTRDPSGTETDPVTMEAAVAEKARLVELSTAYPPSKVVIVNDDVGFVEVDKATALFNLIVTVLPEARAAEAKPEIVSTEEAIEHVGPVAIEVPDPVQEAGLAAATVSSEGKAMVAVAEVERASAITKLKVMEAELDPTVLGLLVTEREERAPVLALYVAPEVRVSMEYVLYEVAIWKEAVGFVVLGCWIRENLRPIDVPAGV